MRKFPAAFWVSIAFGLLGMVMMLADFRIMIFPAYNIAADLREIFVVLGAALSGPFAALTGLLASAYAPTDQWSLHLATSLAHMGAAAWLGWLYQPGWARLPWHRFAWRWLAGLAGYYLVLILIFNLVVSLTLPEWLVGIGGQDNLWAGWIVILQGAWPEAVFTLPFTLALMLALPPHYRAGLKRK